MPIAMKDLAKLALLPNLQTFDIMIQPLFGEDGSLPVIPAHSFPALQDLEIGAHTLTVAGNDEGLGDIIVAWPHLQVLKLGLYSRSRDTNFKLMSLINIAKHCPDLGQLNIAVDASMDQYVLPTREERDIFCESLGMLELGFSKITTPNPVAILLSRIFPRLTCIEGSDEDGQPALWDEVSEHLYWMRLVREEERWSPEDDSA
ncbi:hypothetical protein NEOLEDRAFT_1173181 [Neolentinus lepideus HHB14362 ss-1]|uniref:F-box domain-containing protein n=1 Tax=Neolentinus lepideus HHB14362 ss-1 TaxID=1314782 RepID=A0A165N466_9AGAM|nr:hypothetical protein NEOLEDRAFT_1173181 [Neolentinus lepideus HHB14362 ss-1]